MGTIVINSHQVKDFSEWKQVFDKGAAMRAEAGIKIRNVFQGAENPNQVTVISEVPSVDAAHSIIANLKSVMEKGGVITELMDTRILTEVQ